MQKLGVGCSVYEDKLPIDFTAISTADELNLSAAMRSKRREDELLFTIKQSDYDKLKDDPDFTIIGHITEKRISANFVTKDGTVQELVRKVGRYFIASVSEWLVIIE